MSLSAEHIAKIREQFKLIDTNGDGFITKDELKQVLSLSGIEADDELVNNMMKEADTNGDGKVDLEELIKVHSQ